MPFMNNKIDIETMTVQVTDTSDGRGKASITLFVNHPWSVPDPDSLIMWHDVKIGVELQSGTERVNRWRDVEKQNEFLVNTEANIAAHPLLMIDSDITNIQFVNGGEIGYVEKPDSGNWAAESFTVIFIASLLEDLSPDKQYTLLSSTRNNNSYNVGVDKLVPAVFKREGGTGLIVSSQKFQPVEEDIYYMFTFRFDTLTENNMIIKLNGIPDTLDISNCKVTAFQHCMVGANQKPLAEGWDGGIAEFMVFDMSLADSVLTNIENSLARKYNISLYDRNLLKEEYR
jgi:hypothetical protein